VHVERNQTKKKEINKEEEEKEKYFIWLINNDFQIRRTQNKQNVEN